MKSAKLSIRVKFVGHEGTRELGGHTWNRANQWTVTITDPAFLETLRNYPYGQFQILDDEIPAPDRQVAVISGLSKDRVAELAWLNIHTVGQLVEAGPEHVAANTGASRQLIESWFEQATKMMEATNG